MSSTAGQNRLCATQGGPARQGGATLYTAPALVLVFGVIYAGIAYNGWVSTLKWNGLAPHPRFVGTANYAQALTDSVVAGALVHTVIFAVVTIGVQMGLGLLMALLLSGKGLIHQIYKVILFIPVVMAPSAVSTAFRQILQPDGQLNQLLSSLGLGFLGQSWLADPKWALISLAGINIWQWTGFSFVLYQAALTQLDESTIEAAQIDGASTFRTVVSVIVPQLRSTHVTLIVLGVIGSLKTFDLVFLTTSGGPARATEFMTTYIYQQTVERFNAGYGATLAIILLLCAVSVTLVQGWLARRGGENTR